MQPLADHLMVIHQHEIEIAAEKLEAGLAALAGCAVLGRDLLAFERDMGLVAVVDAQLDAILRQTDAMSPWKAGLRVTVAPPPSATSRASCSIQSRL